MRLPLASQVEGTPSNLTYIGEKNKLARKAVIAIDSIPFKIAKYKQDGRESLYVEYDTLVRSFRM